MKIENIPMEHPVFANCYILTDDKNTEAAIVDPGWFYPSTEKAVKDAEVRGAKLKYILLTHGHFDHIMGVADLKERTGAKIAIHALDADKLTNPDKSLAAENMPMPQKCTEADILLNDGDELFLGEEKISVMGTPGHTPGGVCYIMEKQRAIMSGDTLFCMTVGRTDFEGGDVFELLKSLKKLVALDGDYDVYPGHNRATTLENERTRNRFIRRMEKE